VADSNLDAMSLDDLMALRQQLQGRRTDLQGRIVAKSQELGVDPALSLSVAHQESLFNPEAVSPRDVTGLFQVTLDTGKRFGQTAQNRTDPDVSIHAGVSELKRLLDIHGGNVRQALKGYGDPKQANYADLVLSHYPRYAQMASTHQALDQMPMEELLRLRDSLRGTQSQAPAPAVPAPQAPTPVEQVPEVPPPQDAEPSPLQPAIDIEKESPPAPSVAEYVSFLPGFEFMHPLSAETQQQVLEQTPGVAATGISMLGGTGGAALGTALGGPIGGLVGEAGGSYAARWLNVKLGLEEPGTLGDVLSVATPLAGRAVMGAGKALVRNLPGASAIGHELGEQALEQLPGRYAPPTASRTLFQQAAGQNPPLPVGNLDQAAQAIVQHENSLAPGFRQPKLRRAAQDLTDVIAGYQGRVPMQVLEDYRQRLGLMIGQASEENWPQLAGLRRMYAALHSDLEHAALQGTPGAQTLREAIHASRQEHALDELTNLWSPGRGITTVEGNLANVHGRRILDNFDNLMARDRTFAGSFTPEQATEIRATLQDVARMTSRSPADRGPLAGQTMQWVGRAIGLERAIRGDPAMAVAIGLTVEAAPYAIAALLQTAPGRAAVRQAFMQGDGRLTSAGLAILNQALRQQFPETQSPGAPQGGNP
jgi:Transglycosylase SLT domain